MTARARLIRDFVRTIEALIQTRVTARLRAAQKVLGARA